MSPDMSMDDLIRTIHRLDRDGCKAELLSINRPVLDFTEEFIDEHSTEWMRHVLMAAFLQVRQKKR
jgi:hypothetical protein